MSFLRTLFTVAVSARRRPATASSGLPQQLADWLPLLPSWLHCLHQWPRLKVASFSLLRTSGRSPPTDFLFMLSPNTLLRHSLVHAYFALRDVR